MVNGIEIHPKSTTLVSSPLPLPPDSSSGELVYINTGGKTFKDSEGITWVADTYFNNGGAVEPLAAGDISNTQDDFLYRTGRFDINADPPLKYTIPVARNGEYKVTLHFAETYTPVMNKGGRLFDISINGSKKFQNLDIYDEANGGFKPLKKNTFVTVTNKLVIIEFGHVKENPKVRDTGKNGPDDRSMSRANLTLFLPCVKQKDQCHSNQPGFCSAG